MHTTRKVTPGQKGTKKLLDQYGSRLLCVRYRYDKEKRVRMKTVELIIEEAPWSPPPVRTSGDTLVGVRVYLKEVDLQRRVKQAGGKWNPAQRVWELRYDRVCSLGLEGRIVHMKDSDSRNPKSF